MFFSSPTRGCTMTTIFVLMTLSGVTSSSLRAGQSSPSWQGWMGMEGSGAEWSRSEKASGALSQEYGKKHRARALVQTRNPQCTMPEADPCVLNTTAIGMVEQGYATYYDEGCELGVVNGCYTQDVRECRTCFLSEEIYMAAINLTETELPPWVPCPCCVPTTLAEGHDDLEVQAYDYSIFDISVDSCTDAPTQAPYPTPTPTTMPSMMSSTPSPTPGLQTLAPETPAPSYATTPSPSAVDASTPAPVSSLGSIGASPSSSVTSPTPLPSTSPEAVGVEIAAEDDGDNDGMDTATQVGIGVGVAVGVVIIGLAGFGILKASGRI